MWRLAALEFTSLVYWPVIPHHAFFSGKRGGETSSDNPRHDLERSEAKAAALAACPCSNGPDPTRYQPGSTTRPRTLSIGDGGRQGVPSSCEKEIADEGRKPQPRDRLIPHLSRLTVLASTPDAASVARSPIRSGRGPWGRLPACLARSGRPAATKRDATTHQFRIRPVGGAF